MLSRDDHRSEELRRDFADVAGGELVTDLAKLG